MGRFITEGFLKTFGDVLDYSSIEKDSFIYKALVKGGDREDALIFQVLQDLTRNQPFRWKDESHGNILK